MESMRSLNRSLPSSNQPSEELLRVFKTAAVSVTHLYKEAITGQAQARAAGYQDALDDLLSFLDQKNLGLGDGEGWEVRQWATRRLDDRPSAQGQQEQQEQHNSSESDEEKEPEKEKSPEPHQGESSPIRPARVEEASHEVPAETTLQPSFEAPRQAVVPPSSQFFNFQSLHPYPRDIEMQVTEAVNPRREVSPRATRQNQRKNSRHGHKMLSGKCLGNGGGSKRKLPFGEFFDLSGIVDNDGSKRASKRGKTG